jgi:hypothetical protein
MSAAEGSITGESNPFDVIAAPAYQLVYTAGFNQNLNAGKISSAIMVQLRDQSSNPVTTGAVLTLTSSSTGGTFYSDSAGTTKVTSIAIPAGSSSTSFYYNDTKAGSGILTASSSGLTYDAPPTYRDVCTGIASLLAIQRSRSADWR